MEGHSITAACYRLVRCGTSIVCLISVVIFTAALQSS